MPGTSQSGLILISSLGQHKVARAIDVANHLATSVLYQEPASRGGRRRRTLYKIPGYSQIARSIRSARAVTAPYATSITVGGWMQYADT